MGPEGAPRAFPNPALSYDVTSSPENQRVEGTE